MKRSPFVLSMMICIAVAIFLPAAAPAQATNQAATAQLAAASTKAADYCVTKGGEVEAREPFFNTNDVEQNWLRLSGAYDFCKFTSKVDGSRIYVRLSTLYTELPSLAALAYYAKVPSSGTCNGNPASCYCSQLGGTDLFGGINLNGGGWVNKTDPDDPTLETCIFPDMSTVDSWGLTYHSFGIVRGKNLEHVFRFPNPYSAVDKAGVK